MMSTYCGKSDYGMPGSQMVCRAKNNGWDGQCKDCRIKDLEKEIALLRTELPGKPEENWTPFPFMGFYIRVSQWLSRFKKK